MSKAGPAIKIESIPMGDAVEALLLTRPFSGASANELRGVDRVERIVAKS